MTSAKFNSRASWTKSIQLWSSSKKVARNMRRSARRTTSSAIQLLNPRVIRMHGPRWNQSPRRAYMTWLMKCWTSTYASTFSAASSTSWRWKSSQSSSAWRSRPAWSSSRGSRRRSHWKVSSLMAALWLLNNTLRRRPPMRRMSTINSTWRIVRLTWSMPAVIAKMKFPSPMMSKLRWAPTTILTSFQVMKKRWSLSQ